jgi:hypothetical protein
MGDLLETTYREWTVRKNTREASIALYYKVRDIPYAIIPELNDSERFIDILRLNKGSCAPKHFLLGALFQKLGFPVLYVVYPFRWDEYKSIYPGELAELAVKMRVSYHVACKVEIEGKLVLVDATLDPGLATLGLPVNNEWDGLHDTLLPMHPCGEEQLYHPSELQLMGMEKIPEQSLRFYSLFNSWLEEVRSKKMV